MRQHGVCLIKCTRSHTQQYIDLRDDTAQNMQSAVHACVSVGITHARFEFICPGVVFVNRAELRELLHRDNS